jgi:hypothetical protein
MRGLGGKGGRLPDRFFGQWSLGHARRQIFEPGQPLIENLDAGSQGEDSCGQRASTEKRLCRQHRGSDDAQGEQPVHATPPEVAAGLANGAVAKPPYCK